MKTKGTFTEAWGRQAFKPLTMSTGAFCYHSSDSTRSREFGQELEVNFGMRKQERQEKIDFFEFEGSLVCIIRGYFIYLESLT